MTIKPGEVIEVTPANLTRIAMELIEAQAQIADLKGLLSEVEDSGEAGSCPSCGGYKGHQEDCRLAAALRDSP